MNKENLMKIRRATVLILTVGLFLSVLTADLQSEPRGRHLFFNLSIFYPVSINQSIYDSTNINLSLFYGRVGQVHGFDLAWGVSAVEDNVKGLQVAGLAGVCGSSLTGVQMAGLFAVAGDELSGAQVSGLFNVCGEEGEGLQASSFMNVTGNSFRGIQAAGFMNVAGEESIGLQAAGFMNVAGEESKGLQAAGLMNVTGNTYQGIQAAGGWNVVGESCRGIQAAGLFNVTGETFRGLQAAGVFNVAGERLYGLQVGSMNATATSTGVQIGLANAAGDLEGVQIGLVNYSKNTNGVPVGLVNISKNDGRMRWISWASNLTGVNSGVKFSIKRIYSIVALGRFLFLRTFIPPGQFFPEHRYRVHVHRQCNTIPKPDGNSRPASHHAAGFSEQKAFEHAFAVRRRRPEPHHGEGRPCRLKRIPTRFLRRPGIVLVFWGRSPRGHLILGKYFKPQKSGRLFEDQSILKKLFPLNFFSTLFILNSKLGVSLWGTSPYPFFLLLF